MNLATMGPETGRQPRQPRLSSRVALWLARVLPRGYWRIASWAARRDPTLWDIALPLASPPGEYIRVDMRETVASNFLRHGLIPGQRGHEKLLRGLLRPGDLCFDIGANVGYTAILFASLVQPGGRLVALEPGDRAFRILLRNARERPAITARKLGASAESGAITFYESAMSDVSSIVPVENARQITIQTIALDALAREEGHPCFIKIDVEGHEPAVFAGMTELLRHPQPPIILFEALTDAVLAQCIAILGNSRAAFALYAVAGDGSLSPQLDLRETADFLALPPWATQRLG